MARHLKTPKMNHGVNSTTMEYLDDYMLTQILLRLPSSAAVLACSSVNKRWCSLISDPNFPVQFANHKKKSTTLLKCSGSDHEDDEPPLTFVTTMYSSKQPSITEFIFGSPKLSLDFLPYNTPTAAATFMDLVLCTNYETNQGGSRVYYITNPLTKQWIALPPCPVQKRITRPALICQSPYNHTRDYKFRVVEICDPDHSLESLDTFGLFVYCSEIGEWKEIKLRVPKEAAGLLGLSENVVCNGIIYFKIGLCLVAMDPFDVNATSDTTLEVRVMPPLPDFGYLLESSGQLLVVHTLERRHEGCCLWYKRDARAIELKMVVWKLNPKQAPLVWEKTFQGLCKGTVKSVNNVEFPCYPSLKASISASDVGVHPYNDKLIYMYLALKKELVLCDTRIGCITSSKSLSDYIVSRIHRLEQKWWPTSVPRQCLTIEHLESSDDNC